MQGGGGQNTFSHSMSTNLSDISYIEQNSMYMTTSRVDDYPTSMSSHGTSRITNYDAEMLTGSAAGSSNTYRYKKVRKSYIAYIQKSEDNKRLFLN